MEILSFLNPLNFLKSSHKTPPKVLPSKADDESIREMSEKLKEERANNTQLKAKNQELLNEIILLKTNIRSLIPTINNNDNKNEKFPSFEELLEEIKTFLDIDSLKFYQKFMKNQSNPELIIFYYENIFKKCNDIILSHFNPVQTIFKNKFKNSESLSPIDFVLKNSYQSEWKNIHSKICSEQRLSKLIADIKQAYSSKFKGIINLTVSTQHILKEYLTKTLEIFIKCFINQPRISYNLNIIGSIDKFSKLQNDSFLEEKIVKNTEVLIVLPCFYYSSEKTKRNEIICKSKVIGKNLANFNKSSHKNSKLSSIKKNSSHFINGIINHKSLDDDEYFNMDNE